MKKENSYAGLFIITPEKDESVEDVKGSIHSVISENSGNIVKMNAIGKKELAYPIKKKKEGIYYEVIFTAPTEAIAKMTRMFQINTEILRTIITREE